MFSDWWEEQIRLAVEEAKRETAKKILDKVDNESNGQTKQITDLIRKQYGLK